MSFRVVGIGELLWDILPDGRKLGGAPANFAYHARELGATASVVSRVGIDPLGDEALARLKSAGIPVNLVQRDPAKPTGAVTVKFDSGGQPTYTIHENVAWDELADEPRARHAASGADAICFGTLAQRSERSRTTIQSLLQCTSKSAMRVFDVNLRQAFYSKPVLESSLGLANVLKLNDTELPVLAEMFGIGGDERSIVDALARRFELRCVALTRGSRGSLLKSGDVWSELEAAHVQIVDTIGAGDSFTAATILGMLAGWPLNQVHQSAAELAAFVCSQPGATPALPPSLKNRFAQSQHFMDHRPLNEN